MVKSPSVSVLVGWVGAVFGRFEVVVYFQLVLVGHSGADYVNRSLGTHTSRHSSVPKNARSISF